VDLQSLSLGERIAAGSGAAFFLFQFLSWLETLTAWQLFDIVDVLLALLALVAVALPLAKAAGAELPIRPSNKAILTRIGVIVLTVTVAFFLEGADRGVGIFLSLLAAVGILYGAVTTPGDEAPPRRRDRPRRPRVESDFEEPPPGMERWRESGLYGDTEQGDSPELAEPGSARVRPSTRDPVAADEPMPPPEQPLRRPVGEGFEQRPRAKEGQLGRGDREGGTRKDAPSHGGTNGFAIAALVLGITWLWWLGSVLALVFGYLAKAQIEQSGGTQGGRGIAIAGIVLGWVGVGVLALILVGVASVPFS